MTFKKQLATEKRTASWITTKSAESIGSQAESENQEYLTEEYSESIGSQAESENQEPLIDSLRQCLKEIQTENRYCFGPKKRELFTMLPRLLYMANVAQGGLYAFNENFSTPTGSQSNAYYALAKESHLWGFGINTLGTAFLMGCLLRKEKQSKNAAFTGNQLQIGSKKIIPLLMASATNLAIEISLMIRTNTQLLTDFEQDATRTNLLMPVVLGQWNAFALLVATVGTLLHYLKPEGCLLFFMPLRYQEGVRLSGKIAELTNNASTSTEEAQVKEFMKNLQNVSKEALVNLVEAYVNHQTVSIGKTSYSLPQNLSQTLSQIQIVTEVKPVPETPGSITTLVAPERTEPKAGDETSTAGQTTIKPPLTPPLPQLETIKEKMPPQDDDIERMEQGDSSDEDTSPHSERTNLATQGNTSSVSTTTDSGKPQTSFSQRSRHPN